jgi:hypothetical protein
MTRREQIIQHILGTMTTSSLGVVTLTRSRIPPFAREECPAVNLNPLDDSPTQNVVPKTDWVMRSSASTPLDQLADPIVQALHAAVMSDLTQGGLAMDTQPSGVTWRYADADAGACDIECNFRVQYRTSQSDLTVS